MNTFGLKSVIEPLDHLTSYGAVPPTIFKVIEPVLFPLHFTSIRAAESSVTFNNSGSVIIKSFEVAHPTEAEIV